MDISVPSRFSCLKIEDEEFRPVSNRSSNKKKQQDNKQIKKNNSGPAILVSNKKLPANQQSQSSTSNHQKKHKSKAKQEDKQWADWKKKDDEFVDENFEQDMQSAILQSKLDFENQKKNSVSVILTAQDKGKKKKTKTMSLDQFLENGNQSGDKPENGKAVEEEENFFEKVLVSAKKELKRERLEEKRRERSSNIEEVITLAQCQEKLEKEKAKNEHLQSELEEARKEIALVKKRNTMLCSMLSQGEMKDKAAVLLELERLTNVKEELTEEVTRLHKLLEQERSSTKSNMNGVSESNIHNSKHKDKNKK